MFLPCRNVPAQGADCRFHRHHERLLASKPTHPVDPSYESRSNVLDVTFGTGKLARKKHTWVLPDGHGRTQNLRCINVCVSMDLPQPQELGVLQTRNHPENPLLLRKLQMILKP